MKIAVIDYGMGNLGSVRRAIEECGAECIVTAQASELTAADGLVLPGVGSFRRGMDHLVAGGLAGVLRELALEKDKPLLGICLGMQLLAGQGDEGGVTQGLGLIPGKIKKLEAGDAGERIPHVGWNEIHWTKETPLFEGIPPGTDFYFVHSYHFVPAASSAIAATTPYCGGFVSALSLQRIFGVQFHPEKSSRGGFRLLKNFLQMCQVGSASC